MKVTLVMPLESGIWLWEVDLPFAPFPTLGFRLDQNEVFNVEEVIVDAPNHRFPIACIGHLDGVKNAPVNVEKCQRLGFEKGVYV